MRTLLSGERGRAVRRAMTVSVSFALVVSLVLSVAMSMPGSGPAPGPADGGLSLSLVASESDPVGGDARGSGEQPLLSVLPQVVFELKKPQLSAIEKAARRAARELAGIPGSASEAGEEVAEDVVEPPAPTTFRVGTFNVLGGSHTAADGNKRGFSGGSVRMTSTAQLIRGSGVDVIGLQEFQASQLNAFRGRFGDSFGVYPGLQEARKAVQNSIAWRTSVWQLVQGATFTVPYFHGNPMPMGQVKLRHAATGQEVWFLNVHNPASVRGPAAQYRKRAIAIETALVRRLSADGTPVILMGDFNDRAEAFCPVTAKASMISASGGSNDGVCRTPANAGIDWIFGTTDIVFSGYVRDRSSLVRRASDHPYLHAFATIDPS